MKIPLIKNTFIDEARTKKELAEFILGTDKFSMGSVCMDFEKRFAEFQGRREAVLFNSGGSANLAILQALKNMGLIESGDRAGFSALTWSTNVMPLIQMGLDIFPVDCAPSTLNVMSDELEKAIKIHGLSIFFATNVLGFSGDMLRIKEICHENGVILIEDNCEALGTVVEPGIKTGNFGMSSSFSFFVAHHMSTIEGGMVCTDDEEFSCMLRIVRANGWDRNLLPGQQKKLREGYGIKSEFNAKYVFYDLGYNFRPTEITGFIGLLQMRHLYYVIKRRRQIYMKLSGVVKHNSELMDMDTSPIRELSPFAMPVICRSNRLRDKYLKRFEEAGVEVRPVITGNIQKQPFYSKYVKEMLELPGADFIHECGFYCGLYPEMDESDLEVIMDSLGKG